MSPDKSGPAPSLPRTRCFRLPPLSLAFHVPSHTTLSSPMCQQKLEINYDSSFISGFFLHSFLPFLVLPHHIRDGEGSGEAWQIEMQQQWMGWAPWQDMITPRVAGWLGRVRWSPEHRKLCDHESLRLYRPPLPQPSAITPPSLVLPLNPQVSPHLWHLFIVASCQYTACLLGLQRHPPPLHKFIIVAATCWWFQQLPISYCLHHCLCFVPLLYLL